MTTDVEYALMAANSYAVKDTVTSSINEIPVTSDWTAIKDGRNDSSGFTARAYQNGNQIVIAYTGTTFESFGNDVGDWLTNAFSGSGIGLTQQIVDAAKFYLDIRNNPLCASAAISFTGHSLGGGLASLMSVFFDETATVFADPNALDGPDIAHSEYEPRSLRLGRSVFENVLMVAYT